MSRKFLVYAIAVLASLNSRTLVAEHLRNPGNFHLTSINSFSLRISGFNRPNNTSNSPGVYHINTVGGRNGGLNSAQTMTGPEIASGDYERYQSTDTVDKYVNEDKVSGHLELTMV
ncbi:hypothetical protein AN958_01353 [Leucoagaricus sp. SymC.cos]|nr:hypothetical protein AN958_01353 [Leucoagaricus sp. SymC.cos]